MKQETFAIPSANGQEKLAVTLWQPDTPPRGVVQIVHGMREHMGRYADFASFLASQGFATIGHDQLGHGKTVLNGKPFGYFGEKDGARFLLGDCRNVTHLLQRRFPNLPLFLLGHSMGSFITRIYILRCAKELAGYICMGTGGEEPLAPLGRTLAETLVRMGQGKKEAAFLSRLVFSPYSRHFPDEDDSNAWLSRDKDAVALYGGDTYTKSLLTNAGFRDLMELQLAATSKAWAQRIDKDLPIFLVAGSQDPVGGYGKGVVQTYERLVLAGVLDVQCKLYEGARHEVLNEINREEVYFDLLRWIQQRIQTPSKR